MSSLLFGQIQALSQPWCCKGYVEQGRGPGNIDVPIGGWEQMDGDVRWNQILISLAKLMQIYVWQHRAKLLPGR